MPLVLSYDPIGASVIPSDFFFFYSEGFTEVSCKVVNNKTCSKPHTLLITDHYILQFNCHSFQMIGNYQELKAFAQVS